MRQRELKKLIISIIRSKIELLVKIKTGKIPYQWTLREMANEILPFIAVVDALDGNMDLLSTYIPKENKYWKINQDPTITAKDRDAMERINTEESK